MFLDLFRSYQYLDPASQQQKVREIFPNKINSCEGFIFLENQEIFFSKKLSLIIGVATYSSQDMILLDEIQSISKNQKKAYIFDILNSELLIDLTNFFNYSQKVYQTPVLFYNNGITQEIDWGFNARKRILEIYRYEI